MDSFFSGGEKKGGEEIVVRVFFLFFSGNTFSIAITGSFINTEPGRDWLNIIFYGQTSEAFRG